MRKYAARTDGNQDLVVAAFRSLGCSVAITSTAGSGFVDLVVGVNGVNLLIEVKDGNKPPSQRKLTPAESAFHQKWKGQIAIVNSAEEAIALIHKVRGDFAAASAFS